MINLIQNKNNQSYCEQFVSLVTSVTMLKLNVLNSLILKTIVCYEKDGIILSKLGLSVLD